MDVFFSVFAIARGLPQTLLVSLTQKKVNSMEKLCVQSALEQQGMR
jgi:hypothetical protein